MRVALLTAALAAFAPPEEPAMDASVEEPKAEVPAERSAPEASGDAGVHVPRIDGGYLQVTPTGAVVFTRLDVDEEPNPFGTGGVRVHAGDAVFEWMTVGVSIGGLTGNNGRQRINAGGLSIEFGFYPIPKKALSLRTSFGFGFGTVIDNDEAETRSGFGGALFSGAARYEFFPGVKRYRPARGGGFSLGPELGWRGWTPSGPGQPMAHALYLSLVLGFYFGA